MPVAAATAAPAVCGDSSSASADLSGPVAACAASSSAAVRDDTTFPQAVETTSVKDRLEELLQGKAILLVDDNLLNRFVPPCISQPPCTPLYPPGGGRQLHQPAGGMPFPSFRSHPIRGSIRFTPCVVQVLDDSAISRSQPLCTPPCALSMHQEVDDNLMNRPSAIIPSQTSDPPCLYATGGGQHRHQPQAISVHPCSSPLSHPSLYPLCPQVVDGNLINRRVAASTLARYGAEVALAESGEAALRLLQATHSFRLVLMDLLMPGLDGFQTTARLRAFESQAHTAQGGVQGGQGTEESQCIPEVGENAAEGSEGGWQCQQRVHVVAMSADVDGSVAARATEACMDGAVQKPLNERMLLQLLSTLNGL
ncbi:unnamed protein product [Closterium sp. NIES-64]|nr:unnamed protein product [Closterium sp. NIES-64]